MESSEILDRSVPAITSTLLPTGKALVCDAGEVVGRGDDPGPRLSRS